MSFIWTVFASNSTSFSTSFSTYFSFLKSSLKPLYSNYHLLTLAILPKSHYASILKVHIYDGNSRQLVGELTTSKVSNIVIIVFKQKYLSMFNYVLNYVHVYRRWTILWVWPGKLSLDPNHTHPPTRSLAHSLPHSHTHSLTHTLSISSLPVSPNPHPHTHH